VKGKGARKRICREQPRGSIELAKGVNCNEPGRGCQCGGLLVMALLGFRQQIGDGQVEHAATAHGKQETQHELRQVSQEEPTGQGRAEKRDRDETGPFEGTPNRLSPRRVRPVADEQTNAERLAEVVDQDGQRNEQAKAGLDG
jgi:hypothetical protein